MGSVFVKLIETKIDHPFRRIKPDSMALILQSDQNREELLGDTLTAF